MKKIKLTQGKYALVDNEDFYNLNNFKWSAFRHGKTFYAHRTLLVKNIKKVILMHREIMKTPLKMETDHIDCNGLNNQRYNLRICTRRQNSFNQTKNINNTSGFKGVSWSKNANKWVTFIRINGKKTYLGYFSSKESAHIAYSNACIKYHGEFARYD